MSRNTRITPALYDQIYTRKTENHFLNQLDRKVLAEVLGEENAELTCTGFLSRGDLSRYRAILAPYIRRGKNRGTLLDLGCGFGGLGRELARVLGLKLIGIDFSSAAVKQAQAATEKAPGREISFKVADFSATGLENHQVSAVISLDALYLAPNAQTALDEVCRVLIAGGPLVFTVYVERELASYREGHATPVQWIEKLRASRFTLVTCNDVTEPWRRVMRIKHQRRWLERERISKELGKIGEAELGVSAAMLGLNGNQSFLDSVLRFELICTGPKSN